MTSKRGLAAAAAAAALTTSLLYRPRLLIKLLAKSSPAVLFYVPTKARAIALTIDDGPHPYLTPKILDVLARFGARATFFLLGERVAGNEGLIERIVAEGHELGNHQMSDIPGILLEPEAFRQQLLQADAILRRYAAVRWFRPGSGWYNARMLRQIAGFGYRCVLGSVYPYDAHLHFAPLLSAYTLANVFPGAILALHDGAWERRHTVTVLEQVLPRLQARGYRVLTLSDLAALAD
ncbi:MAG: peptidoglycan-N-acetylglucosamine deacetylase [Caldilineae bacterium]|nr:MAG: peptidoglycan-N-acetylglucosamine deacetylase [Caldilineae bacterium]